MKKRIIGLILAVVMLTLALAGCGYSYAEDDLAKYLEAEIGTEAFNAVLQSLTIKDGAFADTEDNRANMVSDTIYKALASAAGTADKKTEGVIGEKDVLYYCYYATAEFDGEVVTFFSGAMKQSSATKLQMGLSETKDLYALIEREVAAKEFSNPYTTTVAGKTEGVDNKATLGKIAYISYNVSWQTHDAAGALVSKEYTVSNERVVIGEGSEIAKKLAGAVIGTAIEVPKTDANGQTTNSKIFTLTEGGVEKTYSNAVVNWVVDDATNDEYVFNYTPYTESHEEKDAFGIKRELKDKALTYHVFPVYYIEVGDFTADAVVRDLVSSLTEDSLSCFEGKAEAVKAVADAKAALAEAQKARDTKQGELDAANEALSEAKALIKEGEEPSDAIKKSIADAEANVAAATAALAEAEAALTAANTTVDEKISALITEVGAEAILASYEEKVFDDLLATYNQEIRTNLAKAIWEAMQKNVKVTSTPEDAVEKVFDRMMEGHSYTFYTGKDSTTNKTYYNLYSGSFEAYLMNAKNRETYEAAEEAVWNEAAEYVKPIVVVYYFAKLYDNLCTDAEIEEYKEDTSGYYSYYEYTYGEDNVLVAFQFDKLMNYFLESETNEETGVVTYKKLSYTFS